MQEEVESRTVTLAISATKLTGRVMKSAISKYLAWRKDQKHESQSVKPTGKQTVKELVGQNQGVASIEITDRNIKDFERVVRKYGVDFAVRWPCWFSGRRRSVPFNRSPTTPSSWL